MKGNGEDLEGGSRVEGGRDTEGGAKGVGIRIGG